MLLALPLIGAAITAALVDTAVSRYQRMRVEVDAWLPGVDEAVGVLEVVPDLPAQLPELPFSMDALGADISAETLRHHHGEHERAYLTQAWETLETVRPDPRRRPSPQDWRDLSYQVNAVLLHELYWKNLRPDTLAAAPPSSILLDRIEADFGGVSELQHQLDELALSLRGSGWIMLAWSPSLRRMILIPIDHHNDGGLLGAIPLLVLDMWEHAWYLDRTSDKQAYLDAFWNRVDWETVRRRYIQAVRNTDPHFSTLTL
jgi:superoxide dismutase, Fe-Mn family